MESVLIGSKAGYAGTRPAATPQPAVLRLDTIDKAGWEKLTRRPLDPNGFFDPAFTLGALQCAGGSGSMALAAMTPAGDLAGLLPVASVWQAYRVPVPAYVALQPYTTLGTPLLDAGSAQAAARALIEAAANRGRHLLVIPAMPLDGPAMQVLRAAARSLGLAPTIRNVRERAALAVPTDDEAYLREGLGSKKLKELRRQRHRLDDEGSVAFDVLTTPEAIAPAIDRFLALEAAGWKGRRGTGLAQNQGDAAFARDMILGLAGRGMADVVELTLDGRTIASGIVIHQADHALFFKIAYDEAMARFSPGVQLTVALTRHLSTNGRTRYADSTADAGHPMIDHVWRERRRIGDVYLPTIANDPVGPALAGLIVLRHRARDLAKRAFHAIRPNRDRRR